METNVDSDWLKKAADSEDIVLVPGVKFVTPIRNDQATLPDDELTQEWLEYVEEYRSACDVAEREEPAQDSPAVEPRVCKRCGVAWTAGEQEAIFVTCSACRIPSKEHDGGCHYWKWADGDQWESKSVGESARRRKRHIHKNDGESV